MIPREHRLKGGALRLGADEPGGLGPFGTWTGQDDGQGREKADIESTVEYTAGRRAPVET